jgi:hypothetical protein
MGELTIDDLLNALQNPEKAGVTLENSKETWRRIGDKDKFAELGLDDGELESFLKEWMDENPYANL